MYTVFDAHTGIALATIVAETEEEARTEFARRFTGFLGRRLFFIKGEARNGWRGGKVAYPQGGRLFGNTSVVRKLASTIGIRFNCMW